jgi:uncharacterized membrane protein YGL010W
VSKTAPGWLANRYRSWRSRHRNPTNFLLHMVGIPACFVAAPVLLVLLGRWPLAAVFFAAGYALQFLGHLVEGNRSGEEMLLRRLLGRKPDGRDRSE